MRHSDSAAHHILMVLSLVAGSINVVTILVAVAAVAAGLWHLRGHNKDPADKELPYYTGDSAAYSGLLKHLGKAQEFDVSWWFPKPTPPGARIAIKNTSLLKSVRCQY